MKLKALDTMHISSVKPGNILPGEVFEATDSEAKSLIDRGLAVKVAAEPKNKMAGASRNKRAGRGR